MAHEDEGASRGQDFLKGGQSAAYAGVIGDVALGIEGYIEVYTYDCLLAGEIVIVYLCHYLYIGNWVIRLYFETHCTFAWLLIISAKLRIFRLISKYFVNFAVERKNCPMDYLARLKDLYASIFGHELQSLTPLPGAGSSRQYVRMEGPEGSVIGTYGKDARENETFVYLSRVFSEAGLPVPAVFAVGDGAYYYLQQDLGNKSLFDCLHTAAGESAMNRVMRLLPKFQRAKINWSRLYPVKRMRRRHVMADLNYFKYCFLKAVGIDPDEDALDRDFRRLGDAFEQTPPSLTGLILRDCQSRNIMVNEGRPSFIDFQSARMGPVLYDVASLLWQSRARLSGQEREQYLRVYLKEMEKISDATVSQMRESLQLMLWLRTLQVLGAYGLRGITQRKAHFLQSIPQAVENVRELLNSDYFADLHELRRCLQAVINDPRFEPVGEPGELTVSIHSFSYKKGYPDNFTGDGGGFMFDCRGMHNPGRYDEYKPLTGLDTPVRDFLEDRGEVQPFLQGALSLVSPAVRRYAERGFTNLQIGFGCTGGRHRSVYCADKLGRMLRAKFPDSNIRIRVNHREQNINHTL